MRTTLKEIREYYPCADDEPLLISTILESNGVAAAIWCLRAVEGCDREIRLFSVWCARQVEHLSKDARVAECNNISEQYANGLATREELTIARRAANAADTAAYAAASDAYAAYSADNAAASGLDRGNQQIELLRVCKQWEAENLCPN